MKPRIDLTKAIPLPAPLVVFVEPTNVCNFKCPICPESFSDYQQQAGYYQRMARSTWQQVWQSLAAWDKKPVVRFYHVGEPLLNMNLATMISEAHHLGARTELTTNASRLNQQWAELLIDSGLDYVRVSVYGTSDADYFASTGTMWKHGDILQNVKALRRLRDENHLSRPHIYAELVGAGDVELFHWQWNGIADECGVKQLHNWGAALVQLGQQPRQVLVEEGGPYWRVPQKVICPYPFFELVVKANGDVTVCCVDWNGSLVVGNVNDESLQDIWAGERLRTLQQTHLAGRRGDIEMCRDCNVLNASPDNMDTLLPKEVKC